MKRFTLSFLFAFTLLLNITIGCTCIGPSSFCESIDISNDNSFPLILLRGKITGSSTEGKEVEVNQIIDGNVNQEEIIVRNDFCTLYFNELEEEEEYIFALTKSDNDFYLLGCAISFLKIENELVIGKVAPGIESINYKDLIDLESCGNLESINLEKNITLFPNPTIDELKIKNNSSNFVLENLQIKMYDALGREFSNYIREEEISPQEIWTINIQNIPAGVYIIKIHNKYQERSSRIVKQ